MLTPDSLTPDDDVELLAICLGRHRAFGGWDTYYEPDCLHIHVPPPPHSFETRVCPTGLIEFIDETRAKRLVFWGANAIWLRGMLRGYVPNGFRVDGKWNRLLRINFNDYDLEKKAGALRANALKRRGYQFVPGDLSSIDDYETIAAPVIGRIESELQREIYQNIRALARSPQTQLYSAISAGRIAGFVGLRVLTPSYAYFAWASTSAGFPELSDFIYSETIARYSAAVETLDLGYGVNEGIFSYKSKWAPTEILAPRHYVSFSASARSRSIFSQA